MGTANAQGLTGLLRSVREFARALGKRSETSRSLVRAPDDLRARRRRSGRGRRLAGSRNATARHQAPVEPLGPTPTRTTLHVERWRSTPGRLRERGHLRQVPRRSEPPRARSRARTFLRRARRKLATRRDGRPTRQTCDRWRGCHQTYRAVTSGKRGFSHGGELHHLSHYFLRLARSRASVRFTGGRRAGNAVSRFEVGKSQSHDVEATTVGPFAFCQLP